MDINNLRHVVGQAEKDAPAVIRFFGPVDGWTAANFNSEFLWLQESVKPSKIVVLINSEGGSVIEGMSMFSVIQSCPIEVDCVIEGLAASMGSIVWAAGDNLYMHDYSLLMIHNPFMHDKANADENTRSTVNAFRGQLETIYRKRFGLKKEKVRAIMDGEGETDGTWFSAKEAVDAGILPAGNLLNTSKRVCEKVKSRIEGITAAASLCDIMAQAIEEFGEETKLPSKVMSIHNQSKEEIQEHKRKMENKENILSGTVIAQLGYSGDVQASVVSARIAELVKAENDCKEVKVQLEALKVKYSGKEAEVANISAKLSETKSALERYQDAEKAARQAEIEKMVTNAIAAGKIEKGAKAKWLQMAEANMELVKETLASIPTRVNIGEEIAKDPANIRDAEETMKTVEEKVQAKVKEVCGDIKLKTF
jgi:ATP-dependent protease ClpP protease subunit